MDTSGTCYATDVSLQEHVSKRADRQVLCQHMKVRESIHLFYVDKQKHTVNAPIQDPKTKQPSNHMKTTHNRNA